MGRQSTYNPAKADEIVERLAEGEPLRQICRDEHMPKWRTVYDWLDAHPDFATRFAHARALGFDALAEESLDIADDGTNDWIERESKRTGQTYIALNEEAVSRSKLRIETRLKLLAKWDPKRYGERQAIEHSGPSGEPIQIEDRATKAQRLLQLAADRKAKTDDDLDGLV